MTDRPGPCWNFIALATPIIGFAAGIGVGAGGNGVIWSGHPMEGILYGVITWGIFCGIGLLAAGFAWWRSERRWGLTLTAFILNAILPTILLCTGGSELMTWLT